MRIVIKNATKKDFIKFPKGLNLKEAKTRYRYQRYEEENMSGISMEKYADKWFMLPKGNAIFKSYESNKRTKSLRMINELLCQEFAKQFGISCAEYEISHFGGVKGLVSYNVLKDNERLISGYSLSRITNSSIFNNSLLEYNKMLKKLKKVSRSERKALIYELYKQAVFDHITFQTDRHANNVFFIQNEETGKFRTSPIIDNELAFCGDLVENFQLFDSVPELSLDWQYINSATTLTTDKLYPISYKQGMEDFYKIAAKKPAIKRDITERVLGLDVDKAIANVEAQGVQVNEGYKNYLNTLVGYAQNVFKDVFKIKGKDDNEKQVETVKNEKDYDM